ncbi:MAG: hypothetical protein HDQ94_03655 [Desulfovibrio sp.]|nr:hypothetical protein [Desulfovibrio sp.]
MGEVAVGCRDDAGVALSIPLERRLPTQVFRRLLLGMLVLSAVMLFWRGFAA